MAWKMIGNLSSLASLWVNTEHLEEEAEKGIEGDAGEEDDSGDQADEKPRPSKRQYSYMDDDEVKIFDSASELTGLIFDGNPEPKYVAVAPTAITSTLSVEGQKPLFGATRGDFALIAPLFLIIILWLFISLKRARKQRKAGRMDCELVGVYPSPGMKTKGDLESGSV